MHEMSSTHSCLVLDVGSGSGILSLMAARAGANRVWGCELNSLLCEAARGILENPDHTHFASRISYVNAHSSCLTIGEGVHSIPEAVDLIVMELVDSGLLGEHILPVLRHVRALLRPQGRIIPQGAKLFAIPIESPDLRPRVRLLDDKEALVTTGVASCQRSLQEPRLLHGLRFDSLGNLCSDESYTCEDLSYFPHRPLADPSCALILNFESNENTEQTVVFRAASGTLDAIAVYFQLQLDSQSVVDTAPGRPDCGWDQGLYHFGGCFMEAGAYALTTRVIDDRLSFHIASMDQRFEMTACYSPNFQVGEMDLSCLNNRHRHSTMLAALERTVASVRCTLQDAKSPATQSKESDDSPVVVLELSGSFSLVGLSASFLQNISVIVRQSCKIHGVIVRLLAEENGASNLLVQDNYEECTPHVLVIDPVDGSGLLRQGSLEELESLRGKWSKSPPLVMPESLTIIVVPIECAWLVTQNRVRDTYK